MDKKEPGGKVRPAKVGKDNNLWQERKKGKKDKHVHEKLEPKPNNVPKGGKPQAWEARKPPKDKDACFGCGEKGHMKKDCSKVVSASTPRERLKLLLGGCFVAKASLRIGCGNPGSGLMFLQGRINDQHVSMLVDTGASHSFMNPQMVKSLGLFMMRVDNPIEVRFAKGESQVAGRVVGNVPIECGTWKGEESFTIYEMDDINVVLGLTFPKRVDNLIQVRFANGKPQVAGRVVDNVPIECGTWKGEESFTICEMDDINVVLGLTFLEAYNRVFKGKKGELVVQSDDKEFVLPLTKSSEAFGGRLNFISTRELSSKVRRGRAKEVLGCDARRSTNEFPPRREVDHNIEVKPRIKSPSKAPYRLDQKELEALKSQLDEFLAKGYIRQSKSPYGAPVCLWTRRTGS